MPGQVPKTRDRGLIARRSDGYEYYEMLLVYVDDVLIISYQGDKVMPLWRFQVPDNPEKEGLPRLSLTRFENSHEVVMLARYLFYKCCR